ncbi:hypothetical protein DINM_005175 [Dirofilaria immitis]|nr:hypothetical protein [Dirofilaria immitis]
MGSISQFESEIEIYAIRKGVGASPDERFSKAATRVDGFIGEDVTRNVATIKGFPKFLQGVRGRVQKTLSQLLMVTAFASFNYHNRYSNRQYLYPEYKANRIMSPEDLLTVFPRNPEYSGKSPIFLPDKIDLIRKEHDMYPYICGTGGRLKLVDVKQSSIGMSCYIESLTLCIYNNILSSCKWCHSLFQLQAHPLLPKMMWSHEGVNSTK